MSFLYAPSSGNTATSHTGSTFTAHNGLGTATASTLTLTLPSSTVATATADMPRLTKNAITNVWRIDVCARIAAVSGHDTNTFMTFTIRNSSHNSIVFLQAQGNGTVTVYDVGGLRATVGSGVSFSGTEWLRIVVNDGVLTTYIGSGSVGAQNWTPFYSGFLSIPATPYAHTYIGFNLYQGSGAAGTVSVQWADIQTTILQ